MNRIRVLPAILTDDPKKLAEMVRQVETFARQAQFDIMDGSFVPSRSITWEDIARLNTALTWEAHLMVFRPEDYLDGFRRAGASRIVFHYEATADPPRVIREIRARGMGASLALNPETPAGAVDALAREVDSVLFLSVRPGFYGSPFIPEVLGKITHFRRAYPLMEIGIDGGVKESNIAIVAASGVNVIFVGSALLLHPRPAESYRRLLSLANTPR